MFWIQGRYYAWNRSVVRNDSGLLEHSESFSCGSGDTALIFIHGFADLPYSWKRVAERLTNNHNMACHAIRVPRWGESLSSAQGVSTDEIRNAIDVKINALKSDHKKIWLVGHSLGCAFVIDAVPRHQDAITGVVVLAPLIRVSNKRVPCFTAGFWYGIGTKALWLARAFESPFTERVTADDDPQFSYAVDKFIPYSVYNILFSITKSNRDIELPKKLPVFCALSTSDKVIDSGTARNWYNNLEGPKELYIDEAASHTLHHGINWREITDNFGRFIEENNHTYEN